MPYRRVIFGTGEYYHVFNRSVGREKIFIESKDLHRGLDLINYYIFPTDASYSFIMNLPSHIRNARLDQIFSSEPLVEITSFALMPNHYHFVLRQLVENGVIDFLKRFQNSFAKFYNIRHDRNGSVFSSRYKAVRIETDEQLIHVMRYVDLNPVTSYIIDINKLEEYPFASFATYMGNISHPFVSTNTLLSLFKNAESYKEFVFNQADYQRSLKKIKDVLFG